MSADAQQPQAAVPAEGAGLAAPVRAAPPPDLRGIRNYFEPLFAGTGGIDSWLGEGTPQEVFDRLARLPDEPLSRSQLCQLLILSHEAGLSEGFFTYYWMRTPPHTYDVTVHGDFGEGFDPAWISGTEISSLGHLRWGLYRFYVDALLYFGNVRSAYRSLRDKTEEELERFFAQRRLDTEALKKRGPALGLKSIAKDDRYLVAEYACKSSTTRAGRVNSSGRRWRPTEVSSKPGDLRSSRWTSF